MHADLTHCIPGQRKSLAYTTKATVVVNMHILLFAVVAVCLGTFVFQPTSLSPSSLFHS